MQRFWDKVVKTKTCWIWTGFINKARGGYGQFLFNGRPQGAHRVAYLLTKGEIPDGAYVCHKCDNPQCVRPAHLFVGLPKDNASDMVSKQRHASQLRTHCPKGHPLSGDNLYMEARGSRSCYICRCRRKREWARANKST